jgi:cellulose synthase/poly-beta-1,6-N-acetylglucosamine synthase-like glycosyltransferase
MDPFSGRNELLSRLRSAAFIKPESRREVFEKLSLVKDPIAYLVGGDHVVHEGFYKRLAHELDLEYVSDLPMPLSTHQAVAQRVPVELLITHLVYPYMDGLRLVFAVSNPFLSHEILEEILSYITNTKPKLVVTDPVQLKDAIAATRRDVSHIAAEDRIQVFYPEQAVHAYPASVARSRITLGAWAVVAVALFFLFPLGTVLTVFLVANLLYVVINLLKIYTFLRSFWSLRAIQVSDKELTHLDDAVLPLYTVLIPLKREAEIVPQLLRALDTLDYPREKLDVKFAVEVDDDETLTALQQHGFGIVSGDAHPSDFWAQIVEVPVSSLSTKPRSCNYALAFARGTFTVIYDAEDVPDPAQLKKAYIGFSKAKLNTLCLQARLNFYNAKQNLLTRWFSLEYGFWFEHYLRGLGELDTPFPLGGTSNHFITAVLRKIGTWDAYNVTEDADVGFRLSRFGLQTEMLDSLTLEEANSRLWNWIRQRTRWQKGFLQTSLVHFRTPRELVRTLGVFHACMALVTFAGTFFLPFLNPVLWVLFLLSLVPALRNTMLPALPVAVIAIALFNLLVGNLSYIAVHLVSALRSGRKDLAPFALLLPLYWLMHSFATYRALGQFFFAPYRWEKTTHGLRSNKRSA